MSHNHYVITFDVEWCEQVCLDYVFDILNAKDVPATFFQTNNYPELNYKHAEIGLHPNIENLSTVESDAYICEMLEMLSDYDVLGLRAHRLFNSAPLNGVLAKHGLKYQSNYCMYMQKGIKPFLGLNKIYELPVYFMDYYQMEFESMVKPYEKYRNEFHFNSGLKVFCFHPYMIYTNTPNLDYYHENKGKLNINKKRYGVGDFFKDLIVDVDTEQFKYMRDMI